MESRRIDVGTNAWTRWIVCIFRTRLLGCFTEYTFHFIVRLFSTSDGQSFRQKERSENCLKLYFTGTPTEVKFSKRIKHLYGDQKLAF